jgi:glycosyltransferase 2 family protein
MTVSLKAILQYVIMIIISVLLIWFSLRGISVQDGENKWDYIYKTWQSANKGWLLLMAVFAIISHLLRAERWRMLIHSTGENATLTQSFLSLMVGYLVNLVIPRGGEVSRCYNLYKLSRCPVEVSFGTVVVERVIDLICLLLLLAVAFSVESVKLFAFLDTLPFQQGSLMNKLQLVGILVGCLVVSLWFLYMFAKRNQRVKQFLIKTTKGFKDGVLAIFKLDKKIQFVFYSLIIWVLYFLMSYTVILAFHETSHLGWSAVLALFAIGAIAMAAPLPGGTGSYHTLVPAGLSFLYAIQQTDAVAFTFVFHGWQTFIMIAGGALSIIGTQILIRKGRR